MKFTVSTKPLKTATDLVVIDSNVSKYYHRSILLQITVDGNIMTLNTEGTAIFSQVKLIGSAETKSDKVSVLLDNVLFKKLISTINAPQVTIELTDNGIVLTAGKSTYSLPKMMDSTEVSLNAPTAFTDKQLESALDMDKSSWKFIKEHQIYAKSQTTQTTENPVYTYVWTGDSDVIVGDMEKSLFTHSNVGQFDRPCLLSDNIINLLTSMPDDAKVIPVDDSYIITVKSDSYEYTAQFTPKYESEQNGDYNAPIILDMMNVDESTGVIVNSDEIINALNQVMLLSDVKKPIVNFSVSKDAITIKDSRVNCVIPTENEYTGNPYSLIFEPARLKTVISSCTDSVVKICPTCMEDEVVGIIIIDKSLTIAYGGGELE